MMPTDIWKHFATLAAWGRNFDWIRFQNRDNSESSMTTSPRLRHRRRASSSSQNAEIEQMAVKSGNESIEIVAEEENAVLAPPSITYMPSDNQELIRDMNKPKKKSNPALTSQDLEIATHLNRYREPVLMLTLTEALLFQLNVVLRCEPLLENYAELLQENRSTQDEVDAMTTEFKQQLADNEDNDAVAGLQDCDELTIELNEKKEILEYRIRQTKEEVESPRRRMMSDLKHILAESNLLTSDNPEYIPCNTSIQNNKYLAGQIHQKLPTPTLSEQKWMAQEETRREAFEMVQARQNCFHEVQERFDSFNVFYDQEYKNFCAQKTSGDVDATKTDFDHHMYFEGQNATRELIHAEEDLQIAKKHAKNLDIVINQEEQESDFLDHVDDGYRESMEADIVAHVDRNRIIQWMGEDNNQIGCLTECDDWEIKSVDLCDSVSVVAQGKERLKIDGWRKRCELTNIGIDEKGQGSDV